MCAAKNSNGEDYYEYVLLYTDDALVVSEHPKECLLEIDKYFPMKKGSIDTPRLYLGGKISQVQLPNGVIAYALSMSQYVREAIENIERTIKQRGLALNKKAQTPFTTDYSPEIDGSEILNDEDATYYQSLIGISRWIVEIGRIDISMEVSAMSSFIAAPRYGHLLQVLHIFTYLKCHHAARLVFDPSYPNINQEDFPRKYWSGFYGEEKKASPQMHQRANARNSSSELMLMLHLQDVN